MKAPSPGSPAALGIALLAALALALAVGAVAVPPGDLLAVLTGAGDPLQSTLILQLRLPRVLLAAVVGALLALTGALSQGLFRNPLADPSIIGVTGGASLGGALVIASGIAAGAGGQLWGAAGEPR